MATHRDNDAPGSGAAGYSVGYPGSGYSTTHYPAGGPTAEEPTGHGRTQHAERIPRYPAPGGVAGRPADGQVARPAPAPVSPAATRSPATRPADAAPAGEDLRLGAEDLPARPADSPTAAYPMAAPAQAPAAAASSAAPAPPPSAAPTPSAAGTPPADMRQPPRPAPPGPGAGTPAPLSELMQRPTSGVPSTADPAAGRSQLGWVLALLTIVLEVPVAVVLVRSLVGPGVAVGGVLAGLLLLPGMPLFAAGVYGLFTGRIRPAPGEGPAVLLRRPGCYLLVGALLLLVAGLAAG